MGTLELCTEFWHKIHNIQIKDTYSHMEVSKLIKDIEAHLPDLAELNNLPQYLDYYYKDDPTERLGLILTVERIRDAFHLYCKRMNADPVKELE